ncbi:MAG TPA: polysaccharide deacetylase family protein [Lacibacter sp.]|nr:polysaccharide deacetylase family protein [Lacibacter sp.]HMO89273.1 polysaccharide deacetylase family protein [Lacibacter sp.]HMP86046.1 polysaccharide deacetylase family protein [Lacibacter sp.]
MLPCVTTSWDDGHPLDFRIAELLDKYNLKGTFYIPRHNEEHEVMEETAIAELGRHFEIGGHTFHHKAVFEVDALQWREEVDSCYRWLHQLLGTPPQSFCFPKGQINRAAAEAVFAAGFHTGRTTELLSTAPRTGNRIKPTTLQVYEHNRPTYIRHLLKRGRGFNLLRWMLQGGETDLERLTEKFLEQTLQTKGCFHLWGHSWEIESCGLWKQLEQMFRRLSGLAEIAYIENKDLPQQSLQASA